MEETDLRMQAMAFEAGQGHGEGEKSIVGVRNPDDVPPCLLLCGCPPVDVPPPGVFL